MRQLRIWVLLAVVAAALAPAAQAGGSASWGTPCAEQIVEQPFVRFGDPDSYLLVPGGTFESGAASWTLAGGAAVIGGNEPFYVHGVLERLSLLLPPGGSATSRPLCASLLHPTLRFFARSLASRVSLIRLEVLFDDGSGRLKAVPFAKLAALPRWMPSPPIPYLVNVTPPPAEGGTIAVAFRFTGISGVAQIDDVYVDPYKHR